MGTSKQFAFYTSLNQFYIQLVPIIVDLNMYIGYSCRFTQICPSEKTFKNLNWPLLLSRNDASISILDFQKSQNKLDGHLKFWKSVFLQVVF